MRIERAGSQRWLVVNRPADKLWTPVRDFWLESGFLLAQDQENLGIMETDYAENRAKLPQDFIRNALGKVFDSLYSTGERDKFRTRLERTPRRRHRNLHQPSRHGRSAHRRQGGSSTGDSTVWQPRATDPELEAEFLRRLMVKLGVTQEQSKALMAAGAAQQQTSRVAMVNNQPVVQIDEGFERAWRRVGLALDRTGFTVEDRDRSQGTYFVRYVEPVANKSEPGFFSKLFSGSAAATRAAEIPHCAQERGRKNHGVGPQRPGHAGIVCQCPAHCAGDCRRPEVRQLQLCKPPSGFFRRVEIQKPGQRQRRQRHAGRSHGPGAAFAC